MALLESRHANHTLVVFDDEGVFQGTNRIPGLSISRPFIFKSMLITVVSMVEACILP